jgi:hypothetical protein
MKPSFHSLIPFLPIFCNCQFRRLDSIQFLCSQALILTGWRLETQLSTLCCSTEFLITILHGSHEKHCFLLSSIILGVFTAPLHNNGCCADHIENSLPIVKACLPRGLFTVSLPSNWYTRHCNQRYYFYWPTFYNIKLMNSMSTQSVKIQRSFVD